MQEMTIEQARDSYSAFEGREFRTYQRETIEAINSSSKRVVVVKAPTGSGKSIIGMTAGELEPKFAYLCSSKALQDQLDRDFHDEIKILKGRSNYPCNYIAYNNAGQCINSPATPCPIQHKCAYKLQKRAVDQSVSDEVDRMPPFTPLAMQRQVAHNCRSCRYLIKDPDHSCLKAAHYLQALEMHKNALTYGNCPEWRRWEKMADEL